jgi:ATP-dependent Lon protease
VLAAHRARLDTVILPSRNEHDLDDVPDDVRESMTFVLVDDVNAVLDAALTPVPDITTETATETPTDKE